MIATIRLACAVWVLVCGFLTAAAAEPAHTIYVFSNGWHTGIVILQGDLPPEAIPEAQDFPAAVYLEFGWGDREFYPSSDPGVIMTLTAAVMPSAAVMHLVGLPLPPDEYYLDVEVAAVGLDPAAFGRLIAAIDGSFDRPQGDRAAILTQGLYENSWFYPARGQFHLFNTCNTWTARMIAAAGLDIASSGIVSADDLMARLRELPNVLIK